MTSIAKLHHIKYHDKDTNKFFTYCGTFVSESETTKKFNKEAQICEKCQIQLRSLLAGV